MPPAHTLGGPLARAGPGTFARVAQLLHAARTWLAASALPPAAAASDLLRAAGPALARVEVGGVHFLRGWFSLWRGGPDRRATRDRPGTHTLAGSCGLQPAGTQPRASAALPVVLGQSKLRLQGWLQVVLDVGGTWDAAAHEGWIAAAHEGWRAAGCAGLRHASRGGWVARAARGCLLWPLAHPHAEWPGVAGRRLPPCAQGPAFRTGAQTLTTACRRTH